MRIYILCDMEGISGIRMIEQAKISEGGPEYAHGRELMMADMNAAIAGCFDGGATEVIACDTHGMGGQVRVEKMDPRAQYETPVHGRLMPSLDASFAGVILLGHHAKAGTINAFLDHTMSSQSWFDFRINDVSVGEIGIEAAYAGEYGVPVIMVSGDEATSVETNALLGDVECAVVKWALARNRARCMHTDAAHDLIRMTAARAVADIAKKRFKPYKPALPATLQLTYYRCDNADVTAANPHMERVDGRTVRTTVKSFIGAWGF